MNDFTSLLQQGNAWLFIPSAILLGALHGLEPGHSKTMMAAFIVAVRGTLKQAVLLGLAAGAQNFWVFCKERLDRSKKEKNHRVGFNSHQ